jgi:hypothetical protein
LDEGVAMDIISRVRQAAEAELLELRARAKVEKWDLDRIEREKVLFELGHEVTLCSTAGCLNLAEPIPGYRDLHCSACAEKYKNGE